MARWQRTVARLCRNRTSRCRIAQPVSCSKWLAARGLQTCFTGTGQWQGKLAGSGASMRAPRILGAKARQTRSVDSMDEDDGTRNKLTVATRW